MKREVELKFAVKNLGPTRAKLQELGGKLDWAGVEKNWYFDTPARDLKKKGAVLRMRFTHNGLLTYKENSKKGEFKEVDEYQIKVEKDEVKEVKTILGKLGLEVRLAYDKKREYWSIGKADLTLDSFEFGKYVEIEADERKIRELAGKLGLDFAKSTTKSYIQLIEENK